MIRSTLIEQEHLILVLPYCNFSSISLNSIYGIHSSYHSLSLSINPNNIILIIWLTFWYNYLPLFSILILLWVWLYIFNWLNDLYIESFLSITLTEQLSLIYGLSFKIWWVNDELLNSNSSHNIHILFNNAVNWNCQSIISLFNIDFLVIFIKFLFI